MLLYLCVNLTWQFCVTDTLVYCSLRISNFKTATIYTYIIIIFNDLQNLIEPMPILYNIKKKKNVLAHFVSTHPGLCRKVANMCDRISFHRDWIKSPQASVYSLTHPIFPLSRPAFLCPSSFTALNITRLFFIALLSLPSLFAALKTTA